MLPSGLSPMQERLLRSDKYVRLVSAPTGAGKSYAFVRAVVDEGGHVLFMVPTKRLLQNLIKDARKQARERLRQRGLGEIQIRAWIDERIIEWSGNQAADGRGRLDVTRARQLLDGSARTDGRIVFAIPEVVVKMLSGVAVTGASAINPFLFLRSFDHVVFDEFHTIDDRSFGLACLFSLLAVEEQQGRVSLLSATPIDVTAVLEHLGVGPNDVEMITEAIVDGHPPGHRPIHGNVTVSLRRCSLPESLALSIDDVQASISAGRTVIVIYDSLKWLKRDEPEIRRILTATGVANARILAINSLDDSARRPGEATRGRRYKDPTNYDVLLCTSSVEVGVTFSSTLMFMEPGHGLASFVQRVGRVARGADDGCVFVSLTEQRRGRSAWTRRVVAVLERQDELDVQAFIGEILRDVRRRFEPTPQEVKTGFAAEGAAVPFYRRVSWRGAFWAALFVVAIRRTKMKVQRGARVRLEEIAPKIVKFVDAKINEVLSVEVVNDNLPRQSQPHKQWVAALFTSALTYREIGATVVVVDPDGTRHTVTESFLRRATDVPLVFTEEAGEKVIHLLSRTLNEEIRAAPAGRAVQRLRLYIPSPIGRGDFALSIPERDRGTEQLRRRLVEEWRCRFDRFIPASGQSVRDISDPRKKVMAAATALVETLGRPPLDEDYEDSGESTLLA